MALRYFAMQKTNFYQIVRYVYANLYLAWRTAAHRQLFTLSNDEWIMEIWSKAEDISSMESEIEMVF